MNAKRLSKPHSLRSSKKSPPDAARLAAVLQVEVAVAPVLVLRVHVQPERVAGRLGGAMPVQHVLLERVVGREVEAAAEPPCRGLAVLECNEIAHVGVRGGNVRVAWMDHQRHAHGLEARAGQFRPLRRGGGRQLAAHHVREIHAGLLEHLAFAQHATLAAAALGALPRVAPEGGATVDALECGSDRVLERLEVREDCSSGVRWTVVHRAVRSGHRLRFMERSRGHSLPGAAEARRGSAPVNRVVDARPSREHPHTGPAALRRR